jgi:hypothetical protein
VVSLLRLTPLRTAIVGTVALAVLLPSSLSVAAQTISTGTLVGSVTCGADELTPAANAVVAPEGLNMQAQTDGSGQFRLYNVPAGQVLTIDVSDPLGSAKTIRYNVVVPPGTTLDIGSMDLTICPQVGPTAPDNTEQGALQQEERGPAPY